MLFRSAIVLSVLLVSGIPSIGQACEFDSPNEDALARCLIRPIKRGGNLGPTPTSLPTALKALVGKPMTIDIAKLRKYLSDNAIKEADIGGSLAQDTDRLRFFVIHDTSSPEIKAESFPANINEATWTSNNLANWISSPLEVHMYVNRLGNSATKNNFNTLARGTKYEVAKYITDPIEREKARAKRAGLFIHTELIQPRRKSKPTTFYDLAPTPGFTNKQLDRLALLYIAASYRSNRWLLPAFHAAVDATIPDAHDDPQNFDLDYWLRSVSLLVSKAKK